MSHQHPPHQCVNCCDSIPPAVLRYAINTTGYALCISCQDKLRFKLKYTTRQTARLYFLLKERGIAAELTRYDGFNPVDIAISDAKVSIEVDSPNKNYNHRDALAELERTYYSFERGFYTLHIPNELVAYDHTEAVDFIEQFLKISCRRNAVRV